MRLLAPFLWVIYAKKDDPQDDPHDPQNTLFTPTQKIPSQSAKQSLKKKTHISAHL